MSKRLWVAACAFMLGPCIAHAGSAMDEIASAMSAAPEAIARDATVMDFDMKVLRSGTNGWTCFPDDPGTPGKDPMCVDKSGLDWMKAFMARKPPPGDEIGLAYMLAGGSDASNLDPFATKPQAGGSWVTTGPHMMILNARAAERSGYPAKEENPDTSRPYVMFAGTPYAHIMAPVR